MSSNSELDRQIEQLRRCEHIKESEVKLLCTKAREILIEEPNVVKIGAPITVRREAANSYRFVGTSTGSSTT